MRSSIFWNITCDFTFFLFYAFLLLGVLFNISKMEATCSSKILVDLYCTTWHYVLEGITLDIHLSQGTVVLSLTSSVSL
jgi:hypothetical protein